MHSTYYQELINISNNIKISQFIPEVDSPIYHYTGPDAFTSILSKTELRFTNRDYLNDFSEGKYVLNLCIDNSNYICADYLQYENDFKKYCHEKLNSKDAFQVFQCSFSLDSDSLCLWNYYTRADRIQGYNLGFDPKLLLEGIKRSNLAGLILSMGKVEYSKKKQSEVLRKIANLFFDKYKSVQPCDPTISLTNTLHLLISKIFILGQYFKRECFSVENEFRIILEAAIDSTGRFFAYRHLSDDKQPHINFFSRSGIIIPYIDLSFSPDALKCIRLSPTLDKACATSAFALSRKNFSAQINSMDKIINSEIPVRY